MDQLHFIAGLPRSGSTLLCNILMQNERLHCSATSGLLDLLIPIRNGWDNLAAMRAMGAGESQQQKLNTLRACVNGFYAHVARPVVCTCLVTKYD